MGKNAYIGVSNVAKKVKNIYVGIGDVAKKVKNAYIGDANGKARLFYSAKAEGGDRLLFYGRKSDGWYFYESFDQGATFTQKKKLTKTTNSTSTCKVQFSQTLKRWVIIETQSSIVTTYVTEDADIGSAWTQIAKTASTSTVTNRFTDMFDNILIYTNTYAGGTLLNLDLYCINSDLTVTFQATVDSGLSPGDYYSSSGNYVIASSNSETAYLVATMVYYYDEEAYEADTPQEIAILTSFNKTITHSETHTTIFSNISNDYAWALGIYWSGTYALHATLKQFASWVYWRDATQRGQMSGKPYSPFGPIGTKNYVYMLASGTTGQLYRGSNAGSVPTLLTVSAAEITSDSAFISDGNKLYRMQSSNLYSFADGDSAFTSQATLPSSGLSNRNLVFCGVQGTWQHY